MSRAFATEIAAKGWLIPTAMQLVPAVALLAAVPFCVESPRWLIAHGRKTDAQTALNRLRPSRDEASGLTAIEAEAIEQALEDDRRGKGGQWLTLLKPRYRMRTFVSFLPLCFRLYYAEPGR